VVTVVVLALAAGCRERAAAFLGFDAGTVPVQRPSEEPHEIHFTFTGPDAVTFNWRGTDGTVRFWTKGAPPRTVEARPPQPLPTSTGGPWQEVVLDGLPPGALVQYELGNPRRPVTHAFRAPVAPGATDFSFVAVGDMGASSDGTAVAVVHRLIGLRDPAFVLGLGDLSYGDMKSQTSVGRHFDDVMVWSRRVAYMPVWGNHEWETGRDDLRNYTGRFALPHAAASPGAPAGGCCGEDWYWFDHGAVRVITYPEPYAAETWPAWAKAAEPLFAEAEGNDALKFVITAGHRPAYSSGVRGGVPALRGLLDGFGKRFPKYVLNLSGHEHVYERTKPQAHVVHVTAGTGGAALQRAPTPCRWNDCKPPPFTAMRAIHHGFVKVAVQPAALVLEAVCGPASRELDDVRCAEGEVFDQTTIPAAGGRGFSGKKAVK
jgi:hypothetical protein